jgi:ubiquitin-activating enzyme E1
MGTLANSDIIVPYVTPSYSEYELPQENNDKIPMCTLRNFPHLIEHCIEWARAQFTDLFDVPVKDFNTMIKNPPFFLRNLSKDDPSVQYDRLKEIEFLLENAFDPSYQKCIAMANKLLIKNFRDKILDLIAIYPKDFTKKDPYTGETTLFWSGAKTFPRNIEISYHDEPQVAYLFAASNVFATMYNIPKVTNIKDFHEILATISLEVPNWVLDSKTAGIIKKDLETEEKTLDQIEEEKRQTSKNTDTTEEDKIKASQLQQSILSRNLASLRSSNKYLKVAEFEKDDDSNFHIDFVTSCANLRAWNYSIKLATRHQCKMIAGKIIPALATTTSMITGLIEMELYKIVKKLPRTAFLNSNINLGTGTFQSFEPDPPIGKKSNVRYSSRRDYIPCSRWMDLLG